MHHRPVCHYINAPNKTSHVCAHQIRHTSVRMLLYRCAHQIHHRPVVEVCHYHCTQQTYHTPVNTSIYHCTPKYIPRRQECRYITAPTKYATCSRYAIISLRPKIHRTPVCQKYHYHCTYQLHHTSASISISLHLPNTLHIGTYRHFEGKLFGIVIKFLSSYHCT